MAPSDDKYTPRHDVNLWSVPGDDSPQVSVQPHPHHHSDSNYRLTSHDSEYRMMHCGRVTSDTSNSRRRQNDNVEVDMPGDHAGNELWIQGGTSFSKQRALSSQTDVRYQHRLKAGLSRDNHMDGGSCWGVSRERGEDHRHFQAKRSCSQILALIGSEPDTKKTSGEMGNVAAAEHVQMFTNVDLTSKSVHSVDTSERTNIPGPPKAVEEMTGEVEGATVEDVEQSGEVEDKLNTDSDTTRHIGDVSPLARSSVDGVELSDKTEDQHIDAAPKTDSDVVVDVIGEDSPVTGSADTDTDLPAARIYADSEQVCFDICFSPLSDWASVDGASSQPSGDEWSLDSQTHNVGQHNSGLGQDEVSVSSDVSEGKGMHLMSPSGVAESEHECAQNTHMHTISQHSNDVGRNEVVVDMDIPDSKATGQDGPSYRHLDEHGYSDIPGGMASVDRVNGDTEDVGINEPVIDCHSFDVSGGCDIVNCHTEKCQPASGNVICSSSDAVNCDSVDSEIVKCQPPESNTLSPVININQNCSIAADVGVICHKDDTNVDSPHTNADHFHTYHATTDDCHIDDTNPDSCHTGDTTSNTVNCHTVECDKTIVSQSVGSGDVVDHLMMCHDDVTLTANCCESENIVTYVPPDTATISCHPDNVINDFKGFHCSPSTLDHICQENNRVITGDTDHNNVDSVDDYIDKQQSSDKDNVDSQFDVTEGGSKHKSEMNEISGLSDDRDSEGNDVINKDNDIFPVDDDEHIFVDRETEEEDIGDKNTQDCFIDTRSRVGIFDDKCYVNDECNKDGHFGDTCKIDNSGTDKICDLGEKETDDDTKLCDDCCVEADTFGDVGDHYDSHIDRCSHFENDNIHDTDCHNESHSDNRSRHHNNDIHEESCHLDNKKTDSCLVDDGFPTNSGRMSCDSSADNIAPMEYGIKANGDKTDCVTPGNDDLVSPCPGNTEDDKILGQSPTSETMPEQTTLEGNTPDSDKRGTTSVHQHAEECESPTLGRYTDTDSMDTIDTMYSSSLDSPPGTSPQQEQRPQQQGQRPQQQGHRLPHQGHRPQQQGQRPQLQGQIPQQHGQRPQQQGQIPQQEQRPQLGQIPQLQGQTPPQVEPDWPHHQRPICLPPAMGRRVDLRAAASLPTRGLPGSTPQLAVTCKRQEGNQPHYPLSVSLLGL